MLYRIRQVLPSLFLSLLGVFLFASSGYAQHVDITPDQSQIELDADIQYWASLGPYPGPAYIAFQNGEFGAEQSLISHGMNHAPETWFGATLHNKSFDDGREGDEFVLILDAPNSVGYRLFLIREDGLTETLVDYSVFQPFDATQHSVNRLKSPEFTIAPDETVTILAHLQLGITPGYSVALLRPDALSEASFRWGVTITAFYAFSLSLLVLGLGFQIAMRSWHGVGYVIMFMLFLANIAYTDGLLFRLVYPQTPAAHFPVGLGLLLSVAALGFGILAQGLFTRIKTKRVTVFAALIALAAFGVLAVSAVFWIQSNWVANIIAALVVLSIGLNVFLPKGVSQSDTNPNIGIRTVTFLAAAIVLLLFLWTALNGSASWISTRGLVKVSFIVMALMVMTFLTGNLLALRLRYLRAVEARLIAVEAQAEQSSQLLETERAYNRARDTAAARQRQLATASHDIKQPLMSLRTTLDAMTSDMDQPVRDRLQESFLYLEELSKSYVDSTISEDFEGIEEENDETTGIEEYGVSVPLQTVQQMFMGEAVSKGLRLRMVETSLQTSAPPVVLMRILTNLVSNALKYTDRGGVVIGLRRASHSICIYDSGCGMTAKEIRAFREAYSKGSTSTGHGLGLSVCFELAAANALPLTVHSVPGKGTVFNLSLTAHMPKNSSF